MNEDWKERIRILADNLEHTRSKLGIFIQDILPDYMRLEWEHATGKAEAAKKKYLQMYDEIGEVRKLIADIESLLKEQRKICADKVAEITFYSKKGIIYNDILNAPEPSGVK